MSIKGTSKKSYKKKKTSKNGGKVATTRIWINGYWYKDSYGRLRWKPGYWKTIKIPDRRKLPNPFKLKKRKKFVKKEVKHENP